MKTKQEIIKKLRLYMDQANGEGAWNTYVGSQLEGDVANFILALCHPPVSKRFLVTYKYIDRTDAALHEDEIIAEDCVEACNKVCENHNYKIEWHTVKEKTEL
jgi:hypothetical protein